jgi:hypothetical protein
MRLLLIASEHCTRMKRHKLENCCTHSCDELHCFVQKRERMVLSRKALKPESGTRLLRWTLTASWSFLG